MDARFEMYVLAYSLVAPDAIITDHMGCAGGGEFQPEHCIFYPSSLTYSNLLMSFYTIRNDNGNEVTYT